MQRADGRIGRTPRVTRDALEDERETGAASTTTHWAGLCSSGTSKRKRRHDTDTPLPPLSGVQVALHSGRTSRGFQHALQLSVATTSDYKSSRRDRRRRHFPVCTHTYMHADMPVLHGSPGRYNTGDVCTEGDRASSPVLLSSVVPSSTVEDFRLRQTTMVHLFLPALLQDKYKPARSLRSRPDAPGRRTPVRHVVVVERRQGQQVHGWILLLA
ncbi:hypothetical protein MRX96_029584 [Rhipicephalus microplus]